MIPFGWGGDFDQRMESAEMDLRLSVDLPCCGAMEEADPGQCASNVPALCAAVERASVPQSYIGSCPVEQRVNSKATLILTRPPMITQLERFLILEQEIVSGRKYPAILWTLQRRWKLKTNWPRIPRACLRYRRPTQPTRANDQGLLDVTKRKNLSVSLRFTSRASSVFVMPRFDAGDVAPGQWAADVHRG